jgi:hypothetical protein
VGQDIGAPLDNVVFQQAMKLFSAPQSYAVPPVAWNAASSRDRNLRLIRQTSLQQLH